MDKLNSVYIGHKNLDFGFLAKKLVGFLLFSSFSSALNRDLDTAQHCDADPDSDIGLKLDGKNVLHYIPQKR
jgi:hypothetical protein